MSEKIIKADFTVGLSKKSGVGSFKVGSLTGVTYDDLVRTFGEPHHGPSPDQKKQTGWDIMFHNGHVYAQIYDWKQSCSVFDVTEWVVGGYDHLALDLVREAIKNREVKS